MEGTRGKAGEGLGLGCNGAENVYGGQPGYVVSDELWIWLGMGLAIGLCLGLGKRMG